MPQAPPAAEFEWDETKSDANAGKHGLAFERAKRLFENPVIERLDARRDYGEPRVIAIGRDRWN